MSSRYAIGLDYRTNSVRALIAKIADGREIDLITDIRAA